MADGDKLSEVVVGSEDDGDEGSVSGSSIPWTACGTGRQILTASDAWSTAFCNVATLCLLTLSCSALAAPGCLFRLSATPSSGACNIGPRTGTPPIMPAIVWTKSPTSSSGPRASKSLATGGKLSWNDNSIVKDVLTHGPVSHLLFVHRANIGSVS